MSRPLLRLAIVDLLLAAGAGLSWHLLSAPSEPPAPAPLLESAVAPVLVRDVTADREPLDVIVERPLFSIDRRPPAAIRHAAPPARDDGFLFGARVAGVVRSTDGGMLILRRGDESRHVAKGGRIGDWTLESIDGARARFIGPTGAVWEAALTRQPGLPSADATAAPRGGARKMPEEKTVDERIAERRALRAARDATTD